MGTLTGLLRSRGYCLIGSWWFFPGRQDRVSYRGEFEIIVVSKLKIAIIMIVIIIIVVIVFVTIIIAISTVIFI